MATHLRARMAYVWSFLVAANDDKDFPVSYLLYVVAVIAVMGGLIVVGIFLWLR